MPKHKLREKISIRLAPDLAEWLSERAEGRKKRLNKIVNQALSEFRDRHAKVVRSAGDLSLAVLQAQERYAQM